MRGSHGRLVATELFQRLIGYAAGFPASSLRSPGSFAAILVDLHIPLVCPC